MKIKSMDLIKKIERLLNIIGFWSRNKLLSKTTL